MRNKKGRAVSGILLLDKPAGVTSNAALQQVKKLFEARKAGHTGSLDPLATGMLPVCFGEATKISGFLLDSDKRYIAECRLGIRTDSADADGKVIMQTSEINVNKKKLQAVLLQFVGIIEQVPPMHSAIKQNGVALYKLARKGLEVVREPRSVTVYDIKLLDFQEDTFKIDVKCSKGTYIRVLADEIGECLGCGAHITSLRRIEVGPFSTHSMYRMNQLNSMKDQCSSKDQGFYDLDQTLLPMEYALRDWPKVSLSPDTAHYICQGQAVFVPNVSYQGDVCLFLASDEFLGIGTVLDDGRIAPKRLMNMAHIG